MDRKRAKENDGSDAERELFVTQKTEGCSEDGDEGSGEIGRRTVSQRETEKDPCEDRQGDELWEHSDSVDGEAAQPLAEIVAVGAEDEVFVAEEGHGDTEGLGCNRCEDHGEGKIVAWEEVAVEEDECRVEDVGEDSVPDTYDEVAEDLRGRQTAA